MCWTNIGSVIGTQGTFFLGAWSQCIKNILTITHNPSEKINRAIVGIVVLGWSFEREHMWGLLDPDFLQRDGLVGSWHAFLTGITCLFAEEATHGVGRGSRCCFPSPF